jgi:osmoprotectant transport system ATP-binding protein
VKAVDSVSLTVGEGEICVFLGPSGCGKSTTLKMINRSDRADFGPRC